MNLRGKWLQKKVNLICKTEHVNRNALRLTEFEKRELSVGERIVIDSIEGQQSGFYC